MAGAPLQSTTEVQLITGKGIEGDTRYFARLSRHTGRPTRRQVTLMEREQIAEHAVALGMKLIAPGLGAFQHRNQQHRFGVTRWTRS